MVYNQCQVYPENNLDNRRILFRINNNKTPRKKQTEKEAHNSLHFTKYTKPTYPKYTAEKSQ